MRLLAVAGCIGALITGAVEANAGPERRPSTNSTKPTEGVTVVARSAPEAATSIKSNPFMSTPVSIYSGRTPKSLGGGNTPIAAAGGATPRTATGGVSPRTILPAPKLNAKVE